MNYKANPTHVMMIFPNFILLLGEMLMVKTGVSDLQQSASGRSSWVVEEVPRRDREEQYHLWWPESPMT